MQGMRPDAKVLRHSNRHTTLIRTKNDSLQTKGEIII